MYGWCFRNNLQSEREHIIQTLFDLLNSVCKANDEIVKWVTREWDLSGKIKNEKEN